MLNVLSFFLFFILFLFLIDAFAFDDRRGDQHFQMVFIFTRDFLDQASHGLATKVHFIYFDGGQWWVAKFRQRNIIEPNDGQRMIGKRLATVADRHARIPNRPSCLDRSLPRWVLLRLPSLHNGSDHALGSLG